MSSKLTTDFAVPCSKGARNYTTEDGREISCPERKYGKCCGQVSTDWYFILLFPGFRWPEELNVFQGACANFCFPLSQFCKDGYIYPKILTYFMSLCLQNGQFKGEEISRPCNIHTGDEKYKFAMHRLEDNFKVYLKEKGVMCGLDLLDS